MHFKRIATIVWRLLIAATILVIGYSHYGNWQDQIAINEAQTSINTSVNNIINTQVRTNALVIERLSEFRSVMAQATATLQRLSKP